MYVRYDYQIGGLVGSKKIQNIDYVLFKWSLIIFLFILGHKDHLKDKEEEGELKTLKDYWTDKNLDDGEKFLRDYILNKKYLEHGGADEDIDDNVDIDDHEDLSEDEKTLEKQEEFEHKYNFRYVQRSYRFEDTS